MALHLGDIAPDFIAETTHGPIQFHVWGANSWVLIFSHPADFTPVCTTELGKTALLAADFTKRGVKVIAISIDDLTSHNNWLLDIEQVNEVKVTFPIIADPDKKVAVLYDMIHPKVSEKATVRSLFIIGPDKKIKLTLTYPASTGRNFTEILRVIDSLQLTANFQVATPADWTNGEDVIIIPAVTNDEAKTKFPKGFKIIKPYLRITQQPNI